MSATIDYLRALRRQQLGQDAGDLAALERAARETNAATMAAKPGGVSRISVRLHIEPHAVARMEQRGMTKADVVAVYRWGEEKRDHFHPNRTRHTMTKRALAQCDATMAARLRRFLGDVVVVASDGAEKPPALITVIPKARTR